MTVRDANAIEAVVGWMDAMRRGDIGAASECFDPRVTWRGVLDRAVCHNRDEVLEMLGDSLVPCPDDPTALELEPGLRGAEAVELITPNAEIVVLGAKVPGWKRRLAWTSTASSSTCSTAGRANPGGRRLCAARRSSGRSGRPGAAVAVANATAGDD